MAIIYFFLATLLFYQGNWLVILAFFPVLVLFFNVWKRAVGGFLLGLIFCSLHEHTVADRGMPATPILPKVTLEGKITSIPNINTITLPGISNVSLRPTQFQFQLSSLNTRPAKANILLTCYDHCPNFKMGERWQLIANVKAVTNLKNPGHFDHVAKLSAKHIHWTGAIKSGSAKCLSEAQGQTLGRLRAYLGNKVAQLMPAESSLGIFNAITLGLTTNLPKEQWDLFRRTGTTHLMIISGAHVGLVAGLSFWITKNIWGSLGSLALYSPALRAGSLGGLIIAFCYGVLSGFGAPTQRALVAYFILSLKYFCNRSFTGWQAWRFGLFAVLVWEPHVVLLPGFYLSFIAVALLLLANQRFAYTGWKKTVCLQVICLVGLMPLTLFWFSYGAVNGFIANLVAIPWVGMVILPLALVSLLLLPFLPYPILLWPVHLAIQGLLKYLSWIDNISFVNIQTSLTEAWVPLAFLVALGMVVFIPLHGIRLAIIALALLGFFPGYPQIKHGEANIAVLDVGQGLSVVVRTSKHTLIYDTGMKFYGGGDMGKLALIPFLRSQGIRRIDKVVISHPDMDHRGGLASLEEAYSVGELIVDNPAFYHRGQNCHRYPTWEWDGIVFRFLPISTHLKNKNDQSCVLQISDRKNRVLLTGDIQKPAENYLIRQYGKTLQSDVLVVPHHGSKTSSTVPFIATVAPQFAIIPAGFANRYHFPHPTTVQTLNDQGVQSFVTMNCGMTEVMLGQGKIVPKTYVHC
ncbi:MAG: DNA internalization-related competence protein ComEC/Rec2 [Legionella sp.]|nr:DNA internalization-related competence protein ComEC/Rec2 [Legionella sp.]